VTLLVPPRIRRDTDQIRESDDNRRVPAPGQVPPTAPKSLPRAVDTAGMRRLRLILAEPTGLWSDLRRPRSGRASYAIAAAAAAVVLLTWLLLREASTARLISDLTEYRQTDSGWLTIVRLPLSAFAPAEPLPVWVAALEMFAGVAVGCAVIGWRATVMVGAVAHVTASLVVRVLLASPGVITPAFAARYRGELDTGPSVVFISLIVCSLLVSRRFALASAFVVATYAVGALTADLAGIEHTVAIVVGAAAAAVIAHGDTGPRAGAAREASDQRQKTVQP
jgi:hypothetical protein